LEPGEETRDVPLDQPVVLVRMRRVRIEDDDVV